MFNSIIDFILMVTLWGLIHRLKKFEPYFWHTVCGSGLTLGKSEEIIIDNREIKVLRQDIPELQMIKE